MLKRERLILLARIPTSATGFLLCLIKAGSIKLLELSFKISDATAPLQRAVGWVGFINPAPIERTSLG
ncbi:hypothetical protein J2X04_002838 [Lysobacter niabensis]|uniref:Uncharacterized protein n=1 Tax=Agrilutibacter niabensis TaxID=380628 RepID=A0ABU1VSP6_9GAMM|nr:hypothetical protein [Lysobacter niabensis]